uniref:Uncharacterized protein n=1 Tax=Anguilla anguilla TaxID=7936 RepID=A0A0E9UNH8_ANGAN
MVIAAGALCPLGKN